MIVSGDLNDWSAKVLDSNNNRPISNVMNIITGSILEDVSKLAPQAARFSQWWDRNNNCVFQSNEVSQLDHIFMSSALYNSIASVKFETDLYQASCDGYNSDHYPILVTLNREI